MVVLLREEWRRQQEDAISSLMIFPFDFPLLDPLHIVAMAAPACGLGLGRGGLDARPRAGSVAAPWPGTRLRRWPRRPPASRLGGTGATRIVQHLRTASASVVRRRDPLAAGASAPASA
ncbi:hypothetical protein U9M48_038707 [Paspalum notatum var. saurae]|uniref:Uncharacterized protein n=1 Tax=Paspalum notatum var. saurae TaxID=547442 RepID=A0AAQ3XAL3_PASNO